MSATVDVWGWRARFRLARGQTIKEVTAKIPAIESGLGTFRNAVRVYPTPDDLANRCEIRVLNMDPHAGSIPWPGPSVTSITQPRSPTSFGFIGVLQVSALIGADYDRTW